MNLSGLFIYPVKSLAGYESDSIDMDRFGPAGDRRWLVTNLAGRFLTQRDHPRMALIEALANEDSLELRADDDAITVAVPGPDARDRLVQVWEDRPRARDAGDAAAGWLSQRLGEDCRLFYMPEDSVRLVDGLYAHGGETVSFADGFPILLISQASLDDLNSRLPSPVPMNRFRPNLVVTGCEPFAEDGWKRIRIGEMTFDVAKPCSRCVVPSIVQETAERDPHINRVLAGYRRFEGKIYFGQNLLYQQGGTLRVGDPVDVLA
jgi:uncharacterized protein YcbX